MPCGKTVRYQPDGGSARNGLAAENEHLVHSAMPAVGLLGHGVHDRVAILLDPAKRGGQVGHDLLESDDQDDLSSAHGYRSELAARLRGEDHVAVLCQGLDAVHLHVRRRAELADLAHLGGPIHRSSPRPYSVEATALLDGFRQADLVQRPRCTLANLSAFGQEAQNDRAGGGRIVDDLNVKAVRAQRFGSAVEGCGVSLPGELLVDRQALDRPALRHGHVDLS